MRRTVMWAAGVVVGFSALAMAISLFNVWYTWKTELIVHLCGGGLFVSGMESSFGPGFHSGGFMEFSGWSWWPDLDRSPPGGEWWLEVPLWMPAAASALVLAPGMVMSRARLGRSRGGHCGSCGYDLTGITGPCPEFGKKP